MQTRLAHASVDPRLRILTTLRTDFLSQWAVQCAAKPILDKQLQTGTFVLGPPGPTALVDVIRSPAKRAGLELEDDLADEMVKEAGLDPPLPLVAFCLEELYAQTAPEHRLSLTAYDRLGRLRGTIRRHATTLLETLRRSEGTALDTALRQIFYALVYIDATGTATRRRAVRNDLGDAVPVPQVIDRLVQGRLLRSDETGGQATLTLADEMLLQEWPELRDWVDNHRVLLQRVQTLIAALGDADRDVRQSAAQALGRIGPAADKAAVPALTTALSDSEWEIRSRVAEALGRIGPAAAEAMPTLIRALGDVNLKVRQNAALALGQIGPAAAEAIPALKDALKDRDPLVAQIVSAAIEQIRSASLAASS